MRESVIKSWPSLHRPLGVGWTEERSFMFPIVLCDEIFEVLKIPAVCPSKIPNWATPGTQTALAPSK